MLRIGRGVQNTFGGACRITTLIDSLKGDRLWNLHFTIEEVHEESDVVTSGPWSDVALMHVDLAT
jgi:hypothetical protein